MPAPTEDSGKQLVSRFILDKLPTLSSFEIAPEHTTSVGTRPPSLYDDHITPSHRLERVHIDPSMNDNFIASLLTFLSEKQDLVQHLRSTTNPVVPYLSAAGFFYDDAGADPQYDESTVATGVYDFLRGAFCLASLNLINTQEALRLHNSQGTHLAFSSRPSREAESKANYLVVLRPELLRLGLVHATTSPRKPFLAFEVKNVLAADPRMYLALLVFTSVCGDPQGPLFPAPVSTCQDCVLFESPRAGLRDAPVPADGPDSAGAPVGISPAELQAAVQRTKEYVATWDAVVQSQRFSKGHLQNAPSAPAYMRPIRDVRAAIEERCAALGIEGELKGEVAEWVQNAVYVTLRAWGHMCRHDLTYQCVSAFSVTWVMRRHREHRCASISPLFACDDPKTPLILPGLVHAACDDLVQRQQGSKEQQSPEPTKVNNKREGNDRNSEPQPKRTKTDSGLGAPSTSIEKSGAATHLHVRFSWSYLQSTDCTVLARLSTGELNGDPGAAAAVIAPSGGTQAVGVLLDTRIDSSALHGVWSGDLRSTDPGAGGRRRVVLKLASTDKHGERLRGEARTYEHLRARAPDLVAHYRGTFTDGEGTTALLMDDVGRRLETFDVEDRIRHAIFETALALHRAGVWHDHLSPRNILVDDVENVHIVDFHEAEIDHDCEGPGECGELDYLAKELGLDAT